MVSAAKILQLSPAKVAGLYLLFGLSWIPITDLAVLTVVESTATIAQLQTIKGWLFIGVSTVLIFGLSHVHTKQRDEVETKLELSNQQLQVLQRVFRHNIRNDLNVVQEHQNSFQVYLYEYTLHQILLSH
jgi:hypothetical protein